MKLLLIHPNTAQAVTDAVLAVACAAARTGTELEAAPGHVEPEVIGARAENALAQRSVLQLAGVAKIGFTSQQTFSEPDLVHAGVVTAARRLVDDQGAEGVLLACVAMAAIAARLDAAIDVPVFDGVSCAVALAEARAGLKRPRARSGSVSVTGGRTVVSVSSALGALLAG